MKRKRVVITGMGLVSTLGTDVNLFYNQLLEGKSPIGPIENFDCSQYPTRFGGEIKNFDAGDYMHRKVARRVDPFTRFAVVAGKKALEMANLSQNLDSLNKRRCGVLIGSGMGGMQAFYEGVETLIKEGYKRVTPFFVPTIISNMAGAVLAIDTGFQGPNYSVSTACATANYALLLAAKEIMYGNCDIMLAGGAEASMNPIGLAGFVASRALSTRNDDPKKASRPWDKDRDGFVMSEGAGVLVLESLEHALARKAPIYAELLGGAMTCDAYHMTDPREDGELVAYCIEEALRDANISSSDVNYINAHATSTLVGDICEIKAIKKVFSDLSNIKMNATKSILGHCLGAAGAVEAIATIKAIETKKLHPTINLDNPIEELQGLDPCYKAIDNYQIKAAISNSFGFGGHNCVLAFGRYSG
jgi:3-oxoacyl-[acyl-carrier-protein] synthase II